MTFDPEQQKQGRDLDLTQLLTHLPRLIVRVSVLLLRQSPEIYLDEEVIQRATNVASGLLVVNATANFFIYCLVGTSFRRVQMPVTRVKLSS